MAAYAYATAEDMTKPAPPKVGEIIQLWEYARRYYWALKKQQEADHDYYNLKVNVATEEGFKLVIPPRARMIVNDAADHIASAPPEFEVPKAKQTDKASKTAEKIDNWMEGFWKRLNEGRPMPLHRKMTIDALKSGMLAVYIRWLPERLPMLPKKWPNVSAEVKDDYEGRVRLAFPFEWTVQDPRYVYPDPGTVGQTWVIQHEWKRVGDVQAQFPEWQGWKDAHNNPRDPNEFVEWLAFFDRHYRAYLADWKFVSYVRGPEPGPVEHGLGMVPWVIRSGGISDDNGEADERFQSMIHTCRGLIDEEVRVMSQGQQIIADTAHPWIIIPHGAEVAPGSRMISKVPQDLVDKIKIQRHDAETPKAIVDWLATIRDLLEEATYSAVVTGRAPSGQRSGFSIAVLAGMARVKFGPIKFNVESACAEAMRKTLTIIENKVKGPVKIWMGGDTEYVIGPADIRGYERVDCEIQSKLVQDEAADADIGVKAYQIGMSLETVLREFFHIKQPLKELDQRHSEDIMQIPAVRMLMWLMAAQRRGIDPQLLQLAMQATGMGGGGPNGQATPQGQSSPGGTPPPGPQNGMEGTAAPGGQAPPGRPSFPLSGPTSPMGPLQGGPSALGEVGQIAGALVRGGRLNTGVELG